MAFDPIFEARVRFTLTTIHGDYRGSLTYPIDKIPRLEEIAIAAQAQTDAWEAAVSEQKQAQAEPPSIEEINEKLQKLAVVTDMLQELSDRIELANTLKTQDVMKVG